MTDKLRALLLPCLLSVLLLSCSSDDWSGRFDGDKEGLRDLVERQLSAAAKDERGLNAFINLNHVGALKRAAHLERQKRRGALYGFTVAVKDNIEVAGMPTTAGTSILVNFIPRKDAPVVASLKRAGAIVIGKTNMHELAYGITSNNYAYGPVANVDNPIMFAGGSSGGTAVAVAAGFARVGLGTDTGGSVRIPAALNGIYGFRPSMGRYSNQAIVLISDTRDTVGVMARNMNDLIAVDRVLSGDDSRLPKVHVSRLRLGVPKGYFYEGLESEVEERINIALKALASADITLVEADMTGVAEVNEAVSFPLVLFETARLLPEYFRQRNIDYDKDTFLSTIQSPDVKAVVSGALGGAITEEVYMTALRTHRAKLQQLYRDYYKRHDVDAIIMPTTPLSTRPIKGSDETVYIDGREFPTFPTYIRNVDPSSNAGIAAISIPMGRTIDGLSVGMEIEAPAGHDKRLLAIARLLSKIIN